MRMTYSLCQAFRALLILCGFVFFGLCGYAQSANGNPPTPTTTNEVRSSQAGAVAFPEAQIKEKLIGEISPGAEMATARSTENHLAWVEKTEGKSTVRLDGKQIGDTYEDLKYLRFSADEQHLAFVAKRKSRWVLVVDGADKSREYGKLTAAELSANGKFFAVGACLEKKCRLVVNGEEMGPEFEDISAPAFTADGEHSIYFGKRNKKWVQVLDGKEQGPEMDDFAYWHFAPNQGGTVVAARMGSDWTWIVNGTPGPAFDVLGTIDFSPDGKHYAYGGTDANWGFKKQKTRGVIVVDGQVAGTFEGKGFGGGWQAMFGTSQRIVSGPHALFPDFHGVSSPQYTPDGRLVYAGRVSEGNVVVYVDGVPGPSFDDIVSPIGISGDGKHIAYLGKKGDSFIEVRDQKLGPSFPGGREISYVDLLMIDNQGSHLAYEIVRGGSQFKEGRTTRALRRMVIDGKATQEYDANGMGNFNFSADGQHYYYEVYGASGDRDRVIFDGRESKLYEGVFRRSVDFVDEATIEFVARDGRRLLRVLETLIGDGAKAR
jgi:hypothetical protein